ncbi:MAG: hypothetical protein DI589_25410 [Shinella sp.]|nr:MAG: hypothetical protein DI589_25410 [Shinella sp.]
MTVAIEKRVGTDFNRAARRNLNKAANLHIITNSDRTAAKGKFDTQIAKPNVRADLDDIVLALRDNRALAHKLMMWTALRTRRARC